MISSLKDSISLLDCKREDEALLDMEVEELRGLSAELYLSKVHAGFVDNSLGYISCEKGTLIQNSFMA